MLGFASSAHADILETKHNLAQKGSGASGALTAEERRIRSREVCVFCHTPGQVELQEAANAEPSKTRVVATWQKSIEANFSFSLFDDIGRSGAASAGGEPVGSVSMACLSCHDSVQAFGVAQGDQGDHPFGVPYRGAVPRGTSASQFRDRVLGAMSAEGGDTPFRVGMVINDDSEFRPVRSGVVNKREVWWAAVADTGQRTKSDLPLYPRRVSSPGGYEQIPFVECTSCHDPHVAREVFLRTPNDNSKLCMTCHIK